MDPHFQVLRLRTQVYFSTLRELPEQQKQEPVDIVTASNFNHLVDDLSSFAPSIGSALPAKIDIASLKQEPVSYRVLEDLESEILELMPEMKS